MWLPGVLHFDNTYNVESTKWARLPLRYVEEMSRPLATPCLVTARVGSVSILHFGTSSLQEVTVSEKS